MVNTGRLRQLHAAFAGGLGCLSLGVITVWPSYTSDLYRSNSTTLLSTPMTKMEESMLGSIPSLSAIIGTAIAGYTLDKFGRKNGGILLSLPFVFSWAIIGVTSSINVILAARFLAGIGAGGTMVLASVLVSEVSEDAIRGTLASNTTFMYTLGTLLSYVIGWFFAYRTVIWLNVTLSVASIGQLMLINESPVYLLRNGMEEKAKLSIARYRGVPVTSKSVLDELSIVKERISSVSEKNFNMDTDTSIEDEEREKFNSENIELQARNTKSTLLSTLKNLLFSPSSRRAFLVVTTLSTIQIFMGMLLVQVYASTVFNETDPKRADLYTVVFAIVQFIGCFVLAAVVDKTGRRVLQIGSSVLLALCLAGLGYLLQFKVAPPWVTLLLLLMYCFLFMGGAGSVPYILLAEVFMPEVINLATTIITEWIWFLNFFVIAIFPYIIEYLGIHGAFYGFSVMSVLSAVISYIILPETAGLSKEEIQRAFLPKRKT